MTVVAAINKFKNFTEWFDRVIFEARIVDDRFPVKGFSIYLENGTYILKTLRQLLEEELHKTGHKEMIFPLVTTDELFGKEAEHIKGFMKEVFVIDKAGGKELDRKLIIRPTSETIMYPMFRLWIRSHADLPLKIHQHCMVYRYETKATRPLYRVREIPWNEAHTVHATASEAEQQVREAIEIYKKVLNRVCIGYLLLKRPEFDKFAGAKYSIAFDAWNPDGRVNQVGTVHNLGRSFARVFEIEFEQKDGKRDIPYQTCYGFGYSRVLAAIIAQHGDDHGCVFPTSVAPIQVVIIPIYFKGQEQSIIEYCRKVHDMLGDEIRVRLDDREDITPGEKFYHWEMMGVPIRVEVGPREVAENKVTIVRRDTFEKTQVILDDMPSYVKQLMEKIDSNLLEKARRMMEEMIGDATTLEEAKALINNRRIARMEWCGKLECAEVIKESAGGEIRGTRYDIAEIPRGNCIVCQQPAKEIIYVARAY